ncbi:MAG: right-handed parallel beta-helix repeat-containing protein, partial [Thermoplasmata archaeon]
MKTQHLFIFVFLLIVAAIAIFTSTAAKAATINVDDSGGKDYTNIQDAINASSIGDTVYVYNGTYYEHLMINKTLSLVGENQSNTTIDGGSTGALITINADYVNVSGFLMRNSGSTGSDAAVKITTTANYSTITYNTMIDTIYGVSVDTGSYNNISHNNIINSISGLTIQWSIHNTVTYNNITNSNYYGLYLGYSSYNNVTSNNASNNGWYGIGLASGSLYSATNYNTINYNTVTNNTLDGIYLYSASNNDIRYNNIYDNKQNGMRVDVNCADTGNTVAGSWWGNASGPYNDTANPSSTGDNITLGITFSPWALSLIDIYAAQPPTQLSIRNITVSASGGKDYTTIQDAINASNNGDMVYVYNGTYYENLTINKTINLVGESNQSTIIKGTGASDSKGIYVTANYVN